MLPRRLIALVCALSLTFNAFAASKTLPSPVGEQLPVELVLNQQELGVDVSTTGAAVTGAIIGGLIGGLVSAAIANAQVKAAEERVTPLRDLLVGYDFNKRIEAELRAKLPSEGLSTDPVITVMPVSWQFMDPQAAKQLPSRALVLTPRYSIDSKFANLRVQVTAQLFDRKPKSNGKLKGKAAFFRIYAFNFQIEDGKLEDNLGKWKSLGNQGMGMLLEQGVVQVSDMIAHDFSAEGRAEWTKRPSKNTPRLMGRTYPGVAVRQVDDYIWVRSGVNFNGYRPLDIPAMVAAMQSAPPAPAVSDAAPAAMPVAEPVVQPAPAQPEVAPAAVPATETVAQPAQPQPEAPAQDTP